VTALAGAAGLLSAAAAERAVAGDTSFMNNVPDPLLAEDVLPEFTRQGIDAPQRIGAPEGRGVGDHAQLPVSRNVVGMHHRVVADGVTGATIADSVAGPLQSVEHRPRRSVGIHVDMHIEARR
jgi:hypothetical protein